jgi:16S rRNA (uracil1498-N3)-methyltransferase
VTVSLHRFFVAQALPGVATSGVVLSLSDADLHHLHTVLRLVPGDRVVVADPAGREAEATLVDVSAARVTADIDEPVRRPPRPHVVLVPAISRRERMELAVQKATELGVSEIWPLLTERCVVRLDQERSARRGERLRLIAQEAAKQSQRADVPHVREPVTIGGFVADAGRFDVVLVPWEEASSGGLGIGAALDAAGAAADASVAIVIGPEGGLTEAEVAALEAGGGVVVTLGATVLRTETAGIVAVALTEYELGALGGRVR